MLLQSNAPLAPEGSQWCLVPVDQPSGPPLRTVEKLERARCQKCEAKCLRCAQRLCAPKWQNTVEQRGFKPHLIPLARGPAEQPAVPFASAPSNSPTSPPKGGKRKRGAEVDDYSRQASPKRQLFSPAPSEEFMNNDDGDTIVVAIPSRNEHLCG